MRTRADQQPWWMVWLVFGVWAVLLAGGYAWVNR